MTALHVTHKHQHPQTAEPSYSHSRVAAPTSSNTASTRPGRPPGTPRQPQSGQPAPPRPQPSPCSWQSRRPPPPETSRHHVSPTPQRPPSPRHGPQTQPQPPSQRASTWPRHREQPHRPQTGHQATGQDSSQTQRHSQHTPRHILLRKIYTGTEILTPPPAPTPSHNSLLQEGRDHHN